MALGSVERSKIPFGERIVSFGGAIYNRLCEANKSSIVPSTHFFRETIY